MEIINGIKIYYSTDRKEEPKPRPYKELLWRRYNVLYHKASTAAEKKSVEEAYKAKLEALKAPKKVYWDLDNNYIDKKTGEYKKVTARVCIPDPEDSSRYKWTNMPYAEVVALPQFKNIQATLRGKSGTLSQLFNYHMKVEAELLNKPTKDKLDILIELRKVMDAALKKQSQAISKSIKYYAYDPIKQLEKLDKKLSNKNAIIACYPYKTKAYNGVEQTVSNGVLEEQLDAESNIYVNKQSNIGSDFILCTNSDITFTGLVGPSWIKDMLARAKVFSLTPRTVEGFYGATEYKYTFDQETNLLNRYKEGVRGMCITLRAMKELTETVLWYEQQAEDGCDLSSPIELHHINGIDVKTVTRYYYHKHLDELADWAVTELRDMQEPIYADKDEMEERALVEGYPEEDLDSEDADI